MRTLTLALVLAATAATVTVTTTAHADKRFAPVDLTVDVKALAPDEQRALAKLIEAARIMDTLFLRQVWAGNEAMLLRLTQTRARELDDFLLNKGPWARLDKNAPFVAGAPAKPPEANFYPPGATKAELDAWLKKLPEAERARASGFFTTVRRAPDGKFMIVPYSVEYQPELALAAAHLRDAAVLTRQPTLKAFLEKRAAAFASNDYYDSDLAWMALDASIEPTIGPYEVYEDEWFNAKAAFEAFITLRDDAETQRLAKFSLELQDIENHLPIDAALRNPKIGALAPIRVVNEVFCAGDANHGVQTAAFNLPNDERIEREHGTKRVMLKNVQEAKFSKVLVPITRVALAAGDQKSVAFDSFFTHILMHELMHGLGPHTVAGQKQTVRGALEDSYSAIEEAKADISGLFAMQYLVDKGVLPKAMERTMYVTFLASAFRSIRFGITEAHGRGQAMQLNYLLDAGAVRVDVRGTFAIEAGKIKDAVAGLTRELMTLQAHGDRARARELLVKLGVVRPEVQRVLDKLKDVPVDIAPRFVTAEKLTAAATAR
jgi:Peptidase family M49